MTTIEESLRGFSLFRDLSAEHLSLLAEGAERRTCGPDERLVRADQPADVVYAVETGRVAIEIESPNRGPLIIETVGDGDLVGVSWMLPPYRWTFEGRTLGDASVIVLDAVGWRRRCEDDPTFGYELFRRFATLIHRRLVAARLRVIDLYGLDRP